ncbi:MAG: hypothetical protein KKD98_10120, partial [Candidatus Thermoplasmatota archaeon]|nr:hypothetical protein [Candidatus Thermoplasmatota archaeon]
VVIFITKIKYENSYVRKITNVYEINGFDRERNMPIFNEIFRWNPLTDKFDAKNSSVVLRRISEQHGINAAVLQKEMERRSKILTWMTDSNITDYKDMARITKAYSTRPDELLDSI